MNAKTRYTLTRLVELGPRMSRYGGQTVEGSPAEICLFHQAETKRDLFIEQLRIAFERFRLIRFIQSPACLKIFDLEENHEPPFVMFSGDTMPLADWVAQEIIGSDRNLLPVRAGRLRSSRLGRWTTVLAIGTPTKRWPMAFGCLGFA
jgi:hypothetical protein